MMMFVAKKCTIPVQSRSFVAVSSSKGVYEPQQHQSCTTFTHSVSSKCKVIMMENTPDKNITILRLQKLGNFIDSDA
ncbi:hypothetical protein HI914_03191 [Erysiphe necator]|nr:hypothetical protein HI914_03191 [Erysiphe necator]